MNFILKRNITNCKHINKISCYKDLDLNDRGLLLKVLNLKTDSRTITLKYTDHYKTIRLGKCGNDYIVDVDSYNKSHEKFMLSVMAVFIVVNFFVLDYALIKQ